jgi:hypothetical protein
MDKSPRIVFYAFSGSCIVQLLITAFWLLTLPMIVMMGDSLGTGDGPIEERINVFRINVSTTVYLMFLGILCGAAPMSLYTAILWLRGGESAIDDHVRSSMICR